MARLVEYSSSRSSRAGIDLSQLPPSGEVEDTRIWKPAKDGMFTVKEDFDTIRQKERVGMATWHKWLWIKNLHPRTAGTVWKLIHKLS
ncbi:hypothetical protein IFM89_030908 [Coptis chinensis]|uniref:Uncharacterized protein n=1 Tax=Coptis chinensis TaxID=261450 RepID=A0A835LWZ0_9MAGN|nr:hypothetical protein IFM89_030908 [Coptis chinensis]